MARFDAHAPEARQLRQPVPDFKRTRGVTQSLVSPVLMT